jgi:hypothetical protein
MIELANAHRRFQLAKADFESRRATLALKFLQLCQPEDGDMGIKLSSEGTVFLVDSCAPDAPEMMKLL